VYALPICQNLQDIEPRRDIAVFADALSCFSEPPAEKKLLPCLKNTLPVLHVVRGKTRGRSSLLLR
jgi:hypothetical protein